MCTPKTESSYFADRERTSLRAAREAAEPCAEIAHRKLAAAYGRRHREKVAEAALHD